MRDDFFNDGSRGLQDRFETRQLADRIVERVARAELSDADRAAIERSSMFFLATADAEGRPAARQAPRAAAAGQVVPQHQHLSTTGAPAQGQQLAPTAGVAGCGRVDHRPAAEGVAD